MLGIGCVILLRIIPWPSKYNYYANKIIFIKDTGLNDLSNRIPCDIKIFVVWWWFGAESCLLFCLYDFTSFLKVFINIDEYSN